MLLINELISVRLDLVYKNQKPSKKVEDCTGKSNTHRLIFYGTNLVMRYRHDSVGRGPTGTFLRSAEGIFVIR